MSRLIATGLSPNVDGSDVRLAIKGLFSFNKWHDASEVDNLREELASFLDIPSDRVFMMISGRSAMLQALKLLGVVAGDEVVMQAFSCVAVVDSIIWAGATPVFADIEKDTLNLSLKSVKDKVTDKTKVIIIQHTFGLPVEELAAIASFAHQRGIYVIEDCTHALGAELDDEMVGTIGDIGIFSFGRDKVISSVFGGAFVLSNRLPKNICEKANNATRNLEPVSNFWVFKQLLHPILTYPTLMPSPLNYLGKLIHLLSMRVGLLSKATSPEEKACKNKPEWIDRLYPGVLATLARKQLQQVHTMNARRTQIANMYRDAGIWSTQREDINTHHSSKRVYLRYPVVVDDPAEYHLFFKKRGIVLGDWYDQVVGPKEVNLKDTGYEMGECPIAEEVSEHIINLPTYPRMSDDDVRKVITAFKECGGQGR